MLSIFPRDVLDEIWELIESVSEDFPTYFFKWCFFEWRFSVFERRNSFRVAGFVYSNGVISFYRLAFFVFLFFHLASFRLFASKRRNLTNQPQYYAYGRKPINAHCTILALLKERVHCLIKSPSSDFTSNLASATFYAT